MHVIFVGALFLAAVFGLFAYTVDKGCTLSLAQTMSMNMLVVLKISHLFYVRNLFGTSINRTACMGTRAVWITVTLATIAQFVVTYLPLAQPILGTKPVPLADSVLIIAIGVLFFAVIETEKQLRLIFTDSSGQGGEKQ